MVNIAGFSTDVYTGDRYEWTRPGRDPDEMSQPTIGIQVVDVIKIVIFLFVIVGLIIMVYSGNFWKKNTKASNIVGNTKQIEKTVTALELSVSDKISTLKELESLLKSGTINLEEFVKLKSEIFV